MKHRSKFSLLRTSRDDASGWRGKSGPSRVPRDFIGEQKDPHVVVKQHEIDVTSVIWDPRKREERIETRKELRTQIIVPRFFRKDLRGAEAKRWAKRHPRGLKLVWHAPDYWLDRPDLPVGMNKFIKGLIRPRSLDERPARKEFLAMVKRAEASLTAR